jgi:siroheme synthase
MGVGNAPLLRRKLLAAGADAATPVVIVENGTLETERAIATDLAHLTDAVARHTVASPAVIFLGLDWAAAGLRRPARVIVHHHARRLAAQRPREERAANAEVRS